MWTRAAESQTAIAPDGERKYPYRGVTGLGPTIQLPRESTTPYRTAEKSCPYVTNSIPILSGPRTHNQGSVEM